MGHNVRLRSFSTLLILVVILMITTGSASAVSGQVESVQGTTSKVITNWTVTPDSAGPGDVIRQVADSTYVLRQERCGVLQPANVKPDERVSFYPVPGPGPVDVYDPRSLFILTAKRTASASPPEQVGQCDVRFRIVTQTEMTLPTADELRGYGAGDGPVQILSRLTFGPGLAPDSSEIRVVSGELPRITLRGISTATSIATTTPPTSPSASSAVTTTTPDESVAPPVRAGATAGAALAILLLALLIGEAVRPWPRLVRVVSLALRLISAGLVVQGVAAGAGGGTLFFNVALFGLSFLPTARRRLAKVATPADEQVLVDVDQAH